MSDKTITTAGPWIVSITQHILTSPYVCVKSAKDDEIIAICGVGGNSDTGTVIANAALIAIAPEMLEALIAIQETTEDESIAELISGVFERLANEAGA